MIRVLRLMEYTYPDVERMEKDMSYWQIPATGTHRLNHNPTNEATLIRSAVLTDFAFPEVKEND